MSDLNNCAFIGRLTKDAIVETVGSKGTQITKFSIANNTGFGTYARTNFFNVSIWGKAGVSVAPYLLKGKQVAVAGVLENQKWTGQDGMSHDNWCLTANSVTLLSDSKGTEQKDAQAETSEDRWETRKGVQPDPVF